MLNHTNRLVLSDLLVAFFKKIFKLKIFLPVNRKGFKFIKPESPYERLWYFQFKHVLRFNLFLYLNLRGLNKITVLNYYYPTTHQLTYKIRSSTKNIPKVKKNKIGVVRL